MVASGALAGFLYLQRKEQATAQAAADAQLADQRASLEALRSQARSVPTCSSVPLACPLPTLALYPMLLLTSNFNMCPVMHWCL